MKRRRKVGLGILVAIGGLAAVLCGRALGLESRQPVVAPLADAPVDAQAVAKILSTAVRRKTVSESAESPAPAAELLALHEDLAKSFPKVHEKLQREVVGRSLLFTWKGTDPSKAPIILCAHMDVVPIEPNTEQTWEKPPFEGVIDDYVWGRGTLDDKGSVVTILAAAEALVNEGYTPGRTVYLAFGQDEEISGANGAVKIVDLLASRGVKAEMVLDEGNPMVDGVVPGIQATLAPIGVAEKGYMSLDLEAKLEGGHSSTPARDSALTVLAHAIDRVQHTPMPARLDGATAGFLRWVAPEVPFGMRVALANQWLTAPLLVRQFGASQTLDATLRTTTAVTVLRAGVKDNVIPAAATATVNFRLLPGDTTDGVIAHVREAIGDDRVTLTPQADTRKEPSSVSRSDNRAFGILATTVREVFPGTLVAPALFLGATDGRNYDRVASDVYRFLPVRFADEDIRRIHGKNERIAVASLGDAVRFYRRLIRAAAVP